MPSIVNSLGSFLFISMSPNPPTRKRRLIIENRAGVDGVAIWQEAVRGEVYRPTTTRDTTSHPLAQALVISYESQVGNIATMAYANIVYPNVVIKDVTCQIQDQIIGIGGFNFGVRALVRAQWELIIL